MNADTVIDPFLYNVIDPEICLAIKTKFGVST